MLKKWIGVFFLFFFIFACNKKEKINEVNKKEIKLITQTELNALSDIFNDDKIEKEIAKYRKEASDLPNNIKTPWSLKKSSKYKASFIGDVDIYYLNEINSISLFRGEIYNKENDEEVNIKVSMFGILSKQEYHSKLLGYPATLRGSYIGVLIGKIMFEFINSNIKEVKEILQEFDLKAISTIFEKETLYPDLKEYLLKLNEINKKVKKLIKKEEKEDKDKIVAIKPFLPEYCDIINYHRGAFSLNMKIKEPHDNRYFYPSVTIEKVKGVEKEYYKDKILNYPAFIIKYSKEQFIIKLRLNKLVIIGYPYKHKGNSVEDIIEILKSFKLSELSKIEIKN